MRSEDLSSNTKPTRRDSLAENDKKIGTVYFGGWTPSILSLEEVKNILDCFYSSPPEKRGWEEVGFWIRSRTPPNLPFSREEYEVSFECNPEDVSEEYIWWLLKLWVNRISLWIQSLNNDTLRSIWRVGNSSIYLALDALEKIMEDQKTMVDPVSINIDFILWLPYSQPWETLTHIKELHRTCPYISHTSVYMLEEALYPKDWKTHSMSEIEMEIEYGEICSYFESIGWHHYEISNWAKPGFECKHNQWYWNHTNTRWFGLSSTSYIDGKRWENNHSFQGYYRWEHNVGENLNQEQISLEKIIFWIRTFSLKNTQWSKVLISDLEKKWLITINNDTICLTPAWIFRENTIISQLIDNYMPP